LDALRFEDVTKTFDGHAAVDRLCLSVPRGTIYGFIGPNGSGKTTTLRMLLHILLPDHGRIEALGTTHLSEIRDQIGYLPEERGLYKRMTVRDTLLYFGRLKGRKRAELAPRATALLERFDLTSAATRKVETLSKGMAQKVQLAATLVADPELLVLDEPLTGLDPVNVELLTQVLVELRSRGTTVLLSTHDMNAAERLCDRVLMIFRGRKVLDGTPDEIQRDHATGCVRVDVDLSDSQLASLPGVVSIAPDGRLRKVEIKGAPEDLAHLLATHGRLGHFESIRPSLHDVFLNTVRSQPEERLDA
jgi:ABC-2 type transport system ATP-binding protein